MKRDKSNDSTHKKMYNERVQKIKTRDSISIKANVLKRDKIRIKAVGIIRKYINHKVDKEIEIKVVEMCGCSWIIYVGYSKE